MKSKMEFICGLCVLESEDLALSVAGRLEEKLSPFFDEINLTFKGSFDKANRSSIDSFRGPGIDGGLKILEKVRSTHKLPVLTDFHLPSQADEVASVCDVIQLPAFLCRQTDLVHAGAVAAKKYNRKLNVKKGQFLAPEDTKNIVDKVSPVLEKENLYLTERGTSFGYNNLIVDMASYNTMKSFGVKVIHDATHCVQRPGGLGKSTGGKREQIEILSRAAIAAGADGIFMEVHPEPAKALSDSATAYELEKIATYVSNILKVRRAVNELN
jgi:2-dehydro-3-deoxyphosphooctonate aldolase (KDO 8-P synthase)